MQKELNGRIRAAADRDAVIESVPEWGVDMGLRPLNGFWRQSVLDTVAAHTEKGPAAVGAAVEKMLPMLICQSAVDPADGTTRIFDDGDAEWIAVEKNGHVINRVGTRIIEISGLRALDEDEAGESSGATGNTGTGTSSPPSSEGAAQ
jgi:hypothetical protein